METNIFAPAQEKFRNLLDKNITTREIIFTIASIIGTLSLGLLLGKFLKIEKKTSHLISCGTAICGGSAIAAISPLIKAEEKQISFALGTVFILNSFAFFF